jgi:hypothetical protein
MRGSEVAERHLHDANRALLELGTALTHSEAFGRIPLHVAADSRCEVAVVAALLRDALTTVGIADCIGGLPVHLACYSGADAAVLWMLVDANPASTLARGAGGRTPLHMLALNGVFDKAAALCCLTQTLTPCSCRTATGARRCTSLSPELRDQPTSHRCWRGGDAGLLRSQ